MIGLLAVMLAVPAATAVLGPAPAGDNGTPVTGDPSPPSSGFWDVGGEHDVIITFKEDCVVEKRLALEAAGYTDPAFLGDVSRSYKKTLEGMHESFLSMVRERYPEVTVNQEYTTVLNGLALKAPSAALDWIS
ncbi:MAG: hypothetical protein GWN18_00875, partial [Thermoplasmata archaeon]|nr:hypothetical protein [Thermoplasmata archaeon]NIS10549.1 hypothetical protein [Thermoplasmata archaeon]NIS18510.1 hypothetical protein [Thermoplasmata archaeon]NIT75494.1 hypothetical protein [Thermoplasmata archaeon]NIV77315.1 hypothetical protein [Thermoplasmata archaeon]